MRIDKLVNDATDIIIIATSTDIKNVGAKPTTEKENQNEFQRMYKTADIPKPAY